MLGLISTLNTAKSGMSATQANINVTSHNISNANTEGWINIPQSFNSSAFVSP